MRKCFSLIPLLVLLPLTSNAIQITEEDYKRAEQRLSKTTNKLVTGTVNYPHWMSNGQLSYRSTTENGERFFVVNALSQKKSLAFDHQKLAESIARVTDTAVEHNKLPFYQIDIDMKGRLDVAIKGKAYQCNLTSYLCELDKNTKKRNELASPDGTKAVFIKDHNLWVRDLVNKTETQLTTDGVKDFGYATNNAGWVRRGSPVVKWSPDSKKLTTFKHDGRKVGEMAIVSTAVGHPEIDVWKYPLPGDENIFSIHRVVIDIESGNLVKLDMAPDAHRSTITDHVAGRDGSLLDIDWADDGQSFAFVSSSRDHKKATLKIADANTGKVTTIFTETQQTFFESGVSGISWHYLAKSNEVIWFSQRSDWGHLYLIDAATGKVKQAITEGDWTVLELLHVDEENDKLIFTGAGREGGDPYFHYLYSVNKDGSELTLLTPEKKHHRVTLRDDGKYFVDSVSTPTIPTETFIRSTTSRSGFLIDKMNVTKLLATGWQAPTPFVVKDRNGEHDIYGLYFTPSNFDETKKYPVINYLYPGPQVGSIRGRHFQASRNDHNAIAELGFIVVAIDALGTPGRSKAFMTAIMAIWGTVVFQTKSQQLNS